MKPRFDELDTGWRFSGFKEPDVYVELLWTHSRGRWLLGTVVGGVVSHDPIPLNLPAPQGVDEDERRDDAERIAAAHLERLGARGEP